MVQVSWSADPARNVRPGLGPGSLLTVTPKLPMTAGGDKHVALINFSFNEINNKYYSDDYIIQQHMHQLLFCLAQYKNEIHSGHAAHLAPLLQVLPVGRCCWEVQARLLQLYRKNGSHELP